MSKRSQKPAKAAVAVPAGYGPLLAELKLRVRGAQVKAALSVNAHLVWLYWQVGHRIAQQQAKAGWGAGVIPRLAADLHAEFPELRGFSERNIGYMIRFSREYSEDQYAAHPHPASPRGRGGAQPAIGMFAEQSVLPNSQSGLSATLLPAGGGPGDEGAQLTLPPEAITAAVDELPRDRSAIHRTTSCNTH